MKDKPENQFVIDYLLLRKITGLLGIFLPAILAAGSACCGDITEIQCSISDYYYTCMRNYFVGTMCAVGFFMYSYRGYEPIDNIMGNIACLCALGVAFFPKNPDFVYCCQPLPNPITGAIHYVSAAGLFAVFSFFSLFLFTRTKGFLSREKRKRNRIYRACGSLMILCLILIPVTKISCINEALEGSNPVFWLETAMLWLFGISWLVKGGFILTDRTKKNNPASLIQSLR